MTDLNRLRVSLTKHGAHKIAELIKAFSANDVLANTWDRYQGIRIDLAQTKSNLSAYYDGTLPHIWDEVRQFGDEHVNDLVLLAIIFSHHRLIETMISASTGEKRGTITRGQVIGGKEYTNFACVLDELGFATEHYPHRVSYDLSRIFGKFELIPLVVQLLTLKLRSANWDDNTDFIDECIALNFHKVAGISEEYFRKWLQKGTISEIVDQDETVEDEPDITDFSFRSGHIQKSEADVVINRASPKLKATLLHNRMQNRLHHYLTQHYPADQIGTEVDSGIGTSIDIVRKEGDEVIFYEIKTDKSVRLCIRKALPQLLEYSYWPDRKLASRLIVVSQAEITEQAKKYITHLREEFSIPIYCQQFDLANEELKDLY